MDDVYLKQLHPENLPARAFLEQEARRSTKAAKALQIFTLQQGIEGTMRHGKKNEPMRLFKGLRMAPGKAFYPMETPHEKTKEELVNYLQQHPDDMKRFFREDVVIQRQADGFQAIPINQIFREEFAAAADHLKLAATTVSHPGLKKYLNLQASALLAEDEPKLQKAADKVWMEEMKDSPIEFCFVPVYYWDRMTPLILDGLLEKSKSDAKLRKALKAANPEDNFGSRQKAAIGVRLGLRMANSDKIVQRYKKHLIGFNKTLGAYTETLRQEDVEGIDIARVHMIALGGSQIQMPGGPIGGWTTRSPHDSQARIVCYYPIQKEYRSPDDMETYRQALLAPEERNVFPQENLSFTNLVGHELGHLLGPRKSEAGVEREAALGKYGSILEELKADSLSVLLTEYTLDPKGYKYRAGIPILPETPNDWMGMLSTMVRVFYENIGAQYLTAVATHLPSGTPSLDEPHKVKNMIKLNYFLEKGVLRINNEGQLNIGNLKKWSEAARELFKMIAEMQLKGDVSEAEKFVTEYSRLERSINKDRVSEAEKFLDESSRFKDDDEAAAFVYGWFINDAAATAAVDKYFQGDGDAAEAFVIRSSLFNGKRETAKAFIHKRRGNLSDLVKKHGNLELNRYTAFDQSAANQL